MARAVVKGWSNLRDTGGSTWEHEVKFAFSEGPAQFFDATCLFQVSNNDSAAQIKAAMATAIRACSVAETGLVNEANQIILPDCTRI